MRRFAFFALGATALCAVAFSPGPDLGLALTIVALTVAFVVLAVPWLTTFLTSSVIWGLIGHGHVHLRAGGLGAGGRHGPPRSILFLLTLWALILSMWSHAVHAAMNLGTSVGHRLANTNTSAQPLPS